MSDIGGPHPPQPDRPTVQDFIDAAKSRDGGAHVKLDPTLESGVRPGRLVGMKGKAWNWVVAHLDSAGPRTRDENRRAIQAYAASLARERNNREAVNAVLLRYLPSLDGRSRLFKEALLNAKEDLEFPTITDPGTNQLRAEQLSRALVYFLEPEASHNRRRLPAEEREIAALLERNITFTQLVALRNHPSIPAEAGSRTRENVLAYGKAVVQGGDERRGNCLEIACAAAYLLQSKMGVSEWSLIYYPDSEDHLFLAIGEVDDPTKPFSEWPDRCAVFDGWAQIACLARDYPGLWSAKMYEWSLQDIRLPARDGGHGDRGDRFASAEKWWDLVKKPKVKYTDD